MKKKGSLPLSALFDTSKSVRVELRLLSESGNVPVRLLPVRESAFKLVRLEKILGIASVLNSLSPKQSAFKPIKLLNQEGTVPLSLFSLKYIYFSFINDDSCVGIVPVYDLINII